ncbi:LytTR family DNA-binding domain-containing protein [Massilia sp. MS-15]|uniref:LytR/AlgR family response regulator transcription factor n=1 Tax=Massilia sp. MS-15 TaxID=2878200 RepID=UPI001CD72070|nr:LytTR family DNA-binding domain-containing protein [Massilia sp. MS-15]MCA1246930.1 LytTR family DNA-binding domain-containing protein [Massilia sp. MS-15]
MRIRTLIVDDEALARRGIRQLLEGDAGIEVVGECADGASAIEAIAALQPDLVFLDIAMPEADGFDVIAAVGGDCMPATIFVTAYDQYAVRAFEVQALDYLLKPVEPARLRDALARARTRLARPDRTDTTNDLAARVAAVLDELGASPARRYLRRLPIRKAGRVLLLDVDEVTHFEATGNYIEVHTRERMHLLRETLSGLEARLDPEAFLRVSRSCIVNTRDIRELQPQASGDFVLLLDGDSEVLGSRRYRTGLDALLRG